MYLPSQKVICAVTVFFSLFILVCVPASGVVWQTIEAQTGITIDIPAGWNYYTSSIGSRTVTTATDSEGRICMTITIQDHIKDSLSPSPGLSGNKQILQVVETLPPSFISSPVSSLCGNGWNLVLSEYSDDTGSRVYAVSVDKEAGDDLIISLTVPQYLDCAEYRNMVSEACWRIMIDKEPYIIRPVMGI